MLRRAQVRAAVASLGPEAVVVLGTAAEVHGIQGLPRSEEIHVSLPGSRARHARPSHAALVVHQLTIAADQIHRRRGMLVTSPVRTLADNLLRVERYQGVALLDSALNLSRVSAGDLPAVAALLRRRRGAVTARTWLAQADGRAQSPLETRVRLRCVDAALPPEHVQLAVRDAAGHLLGIADLAWSTARLLVEADGRTVHDTPAAVHADRRRQNRLTTAGWRILRFTWPDTLYPHHIPTTIREALGRS